MTRQMRLEKCLKYTDTTDNKFACFIAENKAKISASGQTCGQVRKMGLFNPQSREGQAHLFIKKTRDFARICEKIKETRGFVMNPRFGLSDKT